MSCAEVALTTAFLVLFMNQQIWQALIFAWSCVGAEDFLPGNMTDQGVISAYMVERKVETRGLAENSP